MAGFFMSISSSTAGVEIFLSLQQSRNQNQSFGRRFDLAGHYHPGYRAASVPEMQSAGRSRPSLRSHRRLFFRNFGLNEQCLAP